MNRSALTLFELLLVLALLVLVFAISWPAIDGSFEVSRLRAAADDLRGSWCESRVDAMRTGSPFLFRFTPNAAEYTVTRWNWNLTADVADGEVSEAEHAKSSQLQLPDDIVFLGGEVASDRRAAVYSAAAAQSGVVDDHQDAMIVFYPDGTTTDAAIVLKNKRGLQIRVTLRGLTGIARVSDVMTQREMRDEDN